MERIYNSACGICLVAGLMITESVPLVERFGDIPAMLSVNFLLPHGLEGLSIWWLMLPGGIAFLAGLAPCLKRKPHPAHIVLISLGLLYYPIMFFSGSWFVKEHPSIYPILWAVMIFFWVGVVLWVRNTDYLWAGGAMAAVWDLGAAVRGHTLGKHAIGVPYHPGLPPAMVIFIDISLFCVMIILWYIQANPFLFFRRKRAR